MALAGTGVGYPARVVSPQQVGMALFGPYLLGVELASMLLLAGLVSAYHLGWRQSSRPESLAGRHAASGESGPTEEPATHVTGEVR